MLHRLRKWQAKLAHDEARGVSFWTDIFDIKVRTRIYHAFGDAVGDYEYLESAMRARGLILREMGLLSLWKDGVSDDVDLFNYLLTCPDDMVPTVIEALVAACYSCRVQSYQKGAVFESIASRILREHRISFDLINHEMIEFSSRELHTSVIAPTLSLLAESDRWKKVESAYQDALREISNGQAGNAITDAGTALQEAFVLLGCNGNALGPLIKSARKSGLLAAHDGPMADGIDKILHWVSADRSELGDAHSASKASLSDAWLTVHVVGALLLRLARGENRSK